MNRIHRIALAALAVALSGGYAGPPDSAAKPAMEMRGTWLDPDAFATAQARETTLRRVVQANINTLFVLAPTMGRNQGSGDPKAFAELVRQARAKGLAVHGWICNHRRVEGTEAVDFRDSNERRAQAAWALSLLEAYPELDGIHLDYIRYADWSECDAAKMDAVTMTIRQIREAMKGKFPDKFLTATSLAAANVAYRGAWRDGKPVWEGDVPEWYRDWHRNHPDNWFDQRYKYDSKLRQNMVLGPGFLAYQQDSPAWVRLGLLDALMPMQYTSNVDLWKTEVDLWADFLGKDNMRTICMGLGWLTEKGHDDWGYNPSALVRMIKYGRQVGVGGFCIYTLGYAADKDQQLVEALVVDSAINANEAPFKQTAESPLLAPRGR